MPDAELTPCPFCSYPFDQDGLGRHGCPNCEGEGLGESSRPGKDRRNWGDQLVPGPWRDWVVLKPWLFWFENSLVCSVCELRYNPRSRRRAAAWLKVHRHCGLEAGRKKS